MSERDNHEYVNPDGEIEEQPRRLNIPELYRYAGSSALIFGGSWAIVESTPPGASLGLLGFGGFLYGVGTIANRC